MSDFYHQVLKVTNFTHCNIPVHYCSTMVHQSPRRYAPALDIHQGAMHRHRTSDKAPCSTIGHPTRRYAPPSNIRQGAMLQLRTSDKALCSAIGHPARRYTPALHSEAARRKALSKVRRRALSMARSGGHNLFRRYTSQKILMRRGEGEREGGERRAI